MQLDSKSVPLIAGLLVLLVVGVFVVGRSVMGPEGQVRNPAAEPPSATPPETRDLHPQLIAGRASIRAGRLDEALVQLAEVPESDVSYLLAVNDKGIVLEQQDRPAEALAAFDEILEHQPENPFALFGVCHAQTALGLLDEAELSCLRALELDPRHGRARFQLGLIRIAQDRLARAVDAYLRAAKQHSDEDRIRQAALELDRFAREHPQMAGPHYAMAVLARLLVSRETEREELERYLALDPTGVAADNARKKLEELTKLGF